MHKFKDIPLKRDGELGCVGCGLYNVDPEYVCKDGPVFTLAQLAHLPKEY